MKRILLAVLVSSVAGCATEEEVPGYGEGLGTPENPIPHEDSYAVESRVNFTAEMAQIELAVGSLRAFAVNPARALLTQAQLANVPALQALYSSLSTTLKDRLEGWMNVEIDKLTVGGKTLRQFASETASIAATALSQFTVESFLSISPTKVTHSLSALNFTPVSLDIVIPIGGLKADTLQQSTTAIVGEGGALTLGDQRFGLAFGNHAWQAINLASTTLFGGDIRTTFIAGLDCRTIAQTVATKCYSTSCVGNATELQAICDGAADALVAELRERIPAFKLDVFHFIRGNARLVDSNYDGLAEQIVDGMWQAEIDLGGGLRSAPATFSAR